MATNKQKGNKFELECKKILENEGYIVFRAQSTARLIGPGRVVCKDNDLWNLFDLVAKQPGTGNTRWIQCKYCKKETGNHYTARREIKKWADIYMNSHETCEVWHREPYNKNVNVHNYDKGKKEWVVK